MYNECLSLSETLLIFIMFIQGQGHGTLLLLIVLDVEVQEKWTLTLILQGYVTAIEDLLRLVHYYLAVDVLTKL